MSAELIDVLIQNISFGALFAVLFVWTLRTNDRREARYMALLDVYGKQLEVIAAALLEIQNRLDARDARRRWNDPVSSGTLRKE